MPDFGDRIRQAREELGLSKEGLAYLCDVSRQSVIKWEANKAIPETKRWPTIAKALGVREQWLAFNEPPMKEERVPSDVRAAGENEIGPLLDAIAAVARAGEYGLAAQAAEALARRCREIEQRVLGARHQDVDTKGQVSQ